MGKGSVKLIVNELEKAFKSMRFLSIQHSGREQ